jgi:hypothetical protein
MDARTNKVLSSEYLLPGALGSIEFVEATTCLKLERLHLVGSKHEEATSLAALPKSHHSWNYRSDCPGLLSITILVTIKVGMNSTSPIIVPVPTRAMAD